MKGKLEKIIEDLKFLRSAVCDNQLEDNLMKSYIIKYKVELIREELKDE